MDEKNFRLISILEKLSHDRTMNIQYFSKLFRPSHNRSKVKTVSDSQTKAPNL